MADFYVTLEPLEPYFFGSERKLGDGISEAGSFYFIQSEFVPSQTTLLGMIRFFLLGQSGGIRDDYQVDESLIGKSSFILSESIFEDFHKDKVRSVDDVQDFGVIKGISPLFLVDDEERYYMATPKNHLKDKGIYTPYEMIKVDADGRKGSYLLKDYNGKTGITRSYARLTDGRIFKMEELFGSAENIGIHRRSEEEGFFKKEYKYLRRVMDKPEEGIGQPLRFAFFLSLTDDSEVLSLKLPHFLSKGCLVKGIVYMGLGKSAFSIKIRKKENDFWHQAVDLVKRNCPQGLIAYYTVSDTLFLEQPDLSFAIIETGNFRYLMTQSAKKNKKDYWGRMKRSVLHHVVKPGSMFWVEKDKEVEFKKSFDIANCKKIGMNQLIGSDDYESTINEDKMFDESACGKRGY